MLNYEVKLPAFEKHDCKILFIHIPKTGGTTVEETFIENGFSMTYRRGGKYGPLSQDDKLRGCSPQHMHAELLAKEFCSSDFDYIFTVVRHPASRLVSEYKFQKRTTIAETFPSISEWIATLPAILEADPFKFDNHLRPQHEFIWPDCCRIFKLEDGLDAIMNQISREVTDVSYTGLHHILLKEERQSELERLANDFVRQHYKLDFEKFGYLT